jgi:hypothetical protein
MTQLLSGAYRVRYRLPGTAARRQLLLRRVRCSMRWLRGTALDAGGQHDAVLDWYRVSACFLKTAPNMRVWCVCRVIHLKNHTRHKRWG